MGEHFPIDGEDPSEVFDYATVMVIFVGAVFAYVFLITLVGPENKMVSLTHNIEEEEQEAGRESQRGAEKKSKKPWGDEKLALQIHKIVTKCCKQHLAADRRIDLGKHGRPWGNLKLLRRHCTLPFSCRLTKTPGGIGVADRRQLLKDQQ
ncbi:hypothetical protein KL920_003992 [Ogataea angusta]|nr:hypothetical protein KL920_003992 [Ogataea angusta]